MEIVLKQVLEQTVRLVREWSLNFGLEIKDMKVDYAIELLKIDLKYEIESIWQLRHKVHPTMIEGKIEIAKEIRNAIKILILFRTI